MVTLRIVWEASMPTYEYRCNNCGRELEAFHKISDPPLRECPDCHQPTLERLISGGAFVLKGSGWGKDNYTKSKAADKSEGQSADRLQKAIDGSKKKTSSEAA
jgi:putative FmdB family regulatory protein